MGGLRFLWPKFENVSTAKEWAHFAAWITTVATIATLAMGAYQVASGTSGVPMWQWLFNILMLATLAALMFRFSRVASLGALLIYSFNAMFLPMAFPALREIFKVVLPFVGLIYVNGSRAMFAWHRLNRAKLPESLTN